MTDFHSCSFLSRTAGTWLLQALGCRMSTILVLLRVRKWKYSFSSSYLLHWTEVSGELHAPAALPRVKHPLATLSVRFGVLQNWSWKFCRRTNRDLRFSQRGCWEFRSDGMYGCVGGRVVSDVSKEPSRTRAEPDGTRAETTILLSPKRTSPFK